MIAINLIAYFDFSFCQLSLWGANVQPASKETSCTFILDQLASTLTNVLDKTLGGALGGILGGGGSNNKNSQTVRDKNNEKKKNSGGLLGLF